MREVDVRMDIPGLRCQLRAPTLEKSVRDESSIDVVRHIKVT